MAIARALISKPEVIFADEPTGALASLTPAAISLRQGAAGLAQAGE